MQALDLSDSKGITSKTLSYIVADPLKFKFLKHLNLSGTMLDQLPANLFFVCSSPTKKKKEDQQQQQFDFSLPRPIKELRIPHNSHPQRVWNRRNTQRDMQPKAS